MRSSPPWERLLMRWSRRPWTQACGCSAAGWPRTWIPSWWPVTGLSPLALTRRPRSSTEGSRFSTRAEAEKALRKVIDRLGPGGGRATTTLAEFVDEYLEMHQAAPVTIAKLRWLLGKASAKFGEKRLAELTPREGYAW